MGGGAVLALLIKASPARGEGHGDTGTAGPLAPLHTQPGLGFPAARAGNVALGSPAGLADIIPIGREGRICLQCLGAGGESHVQDFPHPSHSPFPTPVHFYQSNNPHPPQQGKC